MPQQEVFFDSDTGDGHIQVLKIYDLGYAREVFDEMDVEARTILWSSLNIEQIYDFANVPSPSNTDSADFLWDELLEAAREDVRLDPNLRSFFVVNEIQATQSYGLYVSADWPSAEAFAKKHIATFVKGLQ